MVCMEPLCDVLFNQVTVAGQKQKRMTLTLVNGMVAISPAFSDLQERKNNMI